MEFITTMEVISIMFQELIRLMETSSIEYCNGNSPETNWNYILGCYSGSVDDSEVYDSTSYMLDDDCFVDGTHESPVVAY